MAEEYLTLKQTQNKYGISRRTVFRMIKRGMFDVKYEPAPQGGGKEGKQIRLKKKDQQEKSILEIRKENPERYRVNPGEVGRNIITPFENGMPILEINKTNKTNTTDTTKEDNHPAVIATQKPVPERCNRVANLRWAIVKAIEEDKSQNHRPKVQIVEDFLASYNTGALLPEVHGEIGDISRSTLYGWVKDASRGGVDALVPQYGGAGISKITDNEKNLLLTLLLHQNRLKIGYAIRLAKDRLTFKDLPTPSSQSTLRRWVNQFQREHFDLWTLRREGEKALNDKVLPYIERDRNLLEVGEGLVADGHRLNFQIVNPFTGKPSRASLVMFWDWRSAYPLGWEIMLEENTQCVASALRNAILTLGKYPKWILLDNGKAFKAKIFTSDVDLTDTELAGMFARLNINAHFAMPYNAQSKPIERFFGTFSEWFERLMPSYTGASIEDKPGGTKRNEKLLRSMRDPRVPKIQEVNEMMFAWREFYADQASKGLNGQTPREIIERSRLEAVGKKEKSIDPDELTYLMMAVEIKNVGRNGVTIFGQHYYDENLYGYRDRVLVRYSLNDLSRVYVFTGRGDFLCECRPVEKAHPMASEGGAPGDMEAVKRAISAKRSLKSQTVRLHKMLGARSAEALPWREIVEEVPDVVRAIEKREEKAQSSKLKVTKLFEEDETDPKGPFHGQTDKTNEMNTADEEQDRPWFGDKDYEKYDWLQEHPEAVNDRDKAWMEDFLSRSSLYRKAQTA